MTAVCRPSRHPHVAVQLQLAPRADITWKLSPRRPMTAIIVIAAIALQHALVERAMTGRGTNAIWVALTFIKAVDRASCCLVQVDFSSGPSQ